MPSWSIYAVGTPEEIRDQVKRHEERYWSGAPDPIRNMVLGHAEKVMAADTRHKYWVLEANMAQHGLGWWLNVRCYPVRDPQHAES
jgi:hypothetical protein